METNKKKTGAKKEEAKTREEVPLQRCSILSGYCDFLAPSPITNSGRADGGWMDRVGITAAGLGHIFEPPNALSPIECFYSNDAYAKAGFCTMQLELHPPLEAIGDASTVQSLTSYLQGYCKDTENEFYKQGNYRKITHVPAAIDDPSTIGSPASMVLQTAFEVPITPGPNIPRGLTATTYAALVHFEGKGNVLFKANNFERHSPPLDYNKMLASITYTAPAAYLGPDPNLSGIRAMGALLRSGGDIGHARSTLARAQTEVGKMPKYCLKCGAKQTPTGGQLLQCGRCKAASYCSQDCQRADWKRHKCAECNPLFS